LSSALTLSSSILLLLQRRYTVFDWQKKYSEPEFIQEGLTSLYGISSQTRTVYGTSKDWYVYYKFIDDSTGKLKRMPNIKAGANRYKTKRLQILIPLRDALAYLLEKV
jgi:hypothetical protein